MKTIITTISISLLLFSGNLQAQQHLSVDSLQKLIPTLTDTAKARAQFWLGLKLMSADPGQSLMLQREANRVFQQYNHQWGLAQTNLILGGTYGMMANDSAIIFLRRSLQYAHIDSVNLLAKAYSMIASYFNYRSGLDSSLYYLLQAREIYERYNDPKDISLIDYKMSQLYRKLGNPGKAREYLEHGIALIGKGVSAIITFNLYDKYALNGYETGDIPRAKEYGLMAIEWLENGKFPGPVLALKISPLNLLGKIARDSLQYEEALKYFHEAFELEQTTGNISPVLFLEIATCYREMKQWNKGLEYASQAYEIAGKRFNPNSLMQSMEIKHQLLAGANRFEEAYKTQSELNELREETVEKENREATEELLVKYETEKKEKEIVIKEKENLELQSAVFKRNAGIGGFAGLTVLLVLLGRSYIKKEKIKREHETRLHKAEQALFESEKVRLKGQLESKNKELVAKAVALLKQNEMLSYIENELKDAQMAADMNLSNKLADLRRELNGHINPEKGWMKFKLDFDQNYPGYIDRLLEKYPAITDREIQLVAYSVVGLLLKDIASMMHITLDSVKKNRKRLRDKFGLEPGADMVAFLGGV